MNFLKNSRDVLKKVILNSSKSKINENLINNIEKNAKNTENISKNCKNHQKIEQNSSKIDQNSPKIDPNSLKIDKNLKNSEKLSKTIKIPYGGHKINQSMSRSELIFSRNDLKYLDFKKSLLEPTIIRPDQSLTVPSDYDLPPNIPPKSLLGIHDIKDRSVWVYPPKPLQEAHEHYLFNTLIHSNKNTEVLSPQDRFHLHIDNVFKNISKAKCGEDLVDILRQDFVEFNPIFTTKTESMRRTIETFLQLGQIKQFAFQNSPKLDDFIKENIDYVKRKLAIFSTSELADTMWCYAKLGVRPSILVDKLVRKIESKINEFNMCELADIFFSFKELRIVSKKTWEIIEKSIILNEPRSLRELSPTQLFQLSYAVILHTNPTDSRKKACFNLCKEITRVWKEKPYVSLHSMLQICRFSTAISHLFPGDQFKFAIPNDLREKALFTFKSGRAEMYSPPFLDPMARETITAHFSVMNTLQRPISLGINGWWLFSFDRRTPAFSLEPASKSWYTKFDDKKRMLGSYMFRNRMIEAFGLHTLHVPYYEWDLLLTYRSRYQYLAKQMAEQLGVTHHLRQPLKIGHIFGLPLKNKDYRTYDKEIEKDRDLAWDWGELCRINAKHRINPNVFLNNSNFQLPHAVYNDEERLRKVDYWND